MRSLNLYRRSSVSILTILCVLLFLSVQVPCDGKSRRRSVRAKTDPITRYIHVAYQVPSDAPDEVVVVCSFSAAGKNDWKAAKAMPLVSETALELVGRDVTKKWATTGQFIERRAAGLVRTVVFNPYPDAQKNGMVNVDFRIQIKTAEGKSLSTQQLNIKADNSDVVYLEDWSKVLQRDAIVPEANKGQLKWSFRTGQGESAGVTFGNSLSGDAGREFQLPQLTYPLDLKGDYAIFACTPMATGVRLRLTGDERADNLSSNHQGEEVLWRWTKMDRQHLVVKQWHTYQGWTSTTVDYVKLVPLTKRLVSELDSQFGSETDKFVVAYWEPYSYAFSYDVQDTLWHRKMLSAYKDARVSLVDMQVNRFGMKAIYETRKSDQLIYRTMGDPMNNDPHPTTDNVGRMQQYTNTLDASVRYAKELGFKLHANFGASNCYPGSLLQGDFSKQHPEWMRGSTLRFEVPEVREYALGLYRETLEIGVEGISIDFCRYPGTIDKPETGNVFLRELRKLADEFARKRGKAVPILVRFPGTGVNLYKNFDYKTWAEEGLVDYLCPSNLQGRHMHIDMAPYIAAVKGTKCKLLPSVEGLSWGLAMPGQFLWRVNQLYELGVPGIHIYQADSRILGKPVYRRCMRMLASSEAVRKWWEKDKKQRTRNSKGIYITKSHYAKGYSGYERLRVWLEGVEMGKVEMYLDDKLINSFEGPPYFLGTEERESDGIIPRGEHKLRIRAKDGDGWLEQTFAIKGAG